MIFNEEQKSIIQDHTKISLKKTFTIYFFSEKKERTEEIEKTKGEAKERKDKNLNEFKKVNNLCDKMSRK